MLKRGIDKYDDEMCKAWNGELDAILTFVRTCYSTLTGHYANEAALDWSVLRRSDSILYRILPSALTKLSRHYQHLPPCYLSTTRQLFRAYGKHVDGRRIYPQHV